MKNSTGSQPTGLPTTTCSARPSTTHSPPATRPRTSTGRGRRHDTHRGLTDDDTPRACRERRLDKGARITESLQLRRLAARMDNERIHAGLPVGDEDRTRLMVSKACRPQAGGIATITSELNEDSSIRLLPVGICLRVSWTTPARPKERVLSVESQGRPRTLVRAKLLSAVRLSVAERFTEGRAVPAQVAAKCGELG